MRLKTRLALQALLVGSLAGAILLVPDRAQASALDCPQNVEIDSCLNAPGDDVCASCSFQPATVSCLGGDGGAHWSCDQGTSP
jgi:hypothetical protein